MFGLTRLFFLLGLSLLLVPQLAFSQADTLSLYNLDSVVVKVGRLENPLLLEPKSVTSFQVSKIQSARQQLSINDYLMQVPGLFALNPNNFAQDLRVSIRGFGARSAFGIRGVKILVDGIPETTPDGQGQTDNLDLALIDNIEILRGPSSGLYGNASGGVLSISTQSALEGNFAEAGITLGAFDLQRYQLKAGIKGKATDVIFNGSYNTLGGFRVNSGVRHATISTNVTHQLSDQNKLKFIFNYTDSPQADDPGGINLETAEADRRAARDANLNFQAGEEVQQLKLASILDLGDFQTKVFYINRDFYGVLPFGFGGIIDLNRNFFGHSSTYRLTSDGEKARNEFLIGYDLQWQSDDRQRFRNEDGRQGEQTFNQEENFRNIAFYVTDNFRMGKWNLNASLRYDLNQLEAIDQELSNGDDSGVVDLNSLNGGLGISFFNSNGFVPFARLSSSFETPTLSELSANPDGGEGFNEELDPQSAINVELGAKGVLDGKLQYEVSLFQIQTTNEIVPFELQDFPGRDFFRNAGETQRNGIEVALQYAPNKRLRISGNYTYSDFQFKEYIAGDNTFDGENLPGIPMHAGALSLRYIHPKGAFFRLTSQQVGRLYANNSNSVEVEAYNLVVLNLGYEIRSKSLTWVPFFGVNNLLDAEYNDNIRINAFGSRFYEPAPGIHIFGGLRIRIE